MYQAKRKEKREALVLDRKERNSNTIWMVPIASRPIDATWKLTSFAGGKLVGPKSDRLLLFQHVS